MIKWAMFPEAKAKAKKAFDEAAEKAWEKAQNGRARTLLTFIEEWSPAPASDKALAYDGMAAEAAKAVTAKGGAVLNATQTLLRHLKTHPTTKARSEIDDLVPKNTKRSWRKKTTQAHQSPQSFARKYPNTTWGDKAEEISRK